jgi:hypothetical protein
MIAIACCETLEAAAIKFDAAKMQVIGVFFGTQTTREEPDLLLAIIDMQNLAHWPLALGDLMLRLTCFDVVKPEVAPAVAFAHPDEFAAAVQPVAPAFAGVVDEGL